MTLLEAVGVLALGGYVGYLSFYYVARLDKYTIGAFGSVLGILFGGVVTQWVAQSADARALYPIGLVIGLVFWIIVRFRTGGGAAAIAAALADPDVK